MLDRYIQIGKVWLQRPLNWIAILALGAILLMSAGDRSSRPAKAYNSPERPSDKKIISSSQTLMKAIARGEVNESIKGIDFLVVGSITREGNMLVPFSEIGDSLTLFPNLQWIRFSNGELQQLRPGALASLRHLKSIEVIDSLIRNTGLQRLAEASSLSWLVMEASELEGTLTPLSTLPDLRTLELNHGFRPATSQSKQKMFRRGVLESISELKSLERVAIDAQWHADGEVQKDVQESLAQLTKLKEVWMGNQQTSEGRILLAQLAATLPGVSVEPARYDVKKLETMLAASLIGIALVLIVGGMLTSHFSTPQSKLIPGYAEPHRRTFIVFLTLATAVGVCAITNITLVAPLPCVSAAALIAALATLCLLHFGVLGPQNIKALTWFPFLLFAGLYGVILFQVAYPPIGCVIDRFLIGLYPIAAMAILITSIAFVIWSVRQFDDQHRWFAENSLPSVVTFEDIKFYQAAKHERQKGMSAFERKVERWERKFAPIARRVRDGNRFASIMRWGYGSPTYEVVRRFGFLALPITILVMTLPLHQNFATNSLQTVCLMMVGYMIGASAMAPVLTVNHDRSISSMELLRPVTRNNFVNERITLALFQVVGCLAFTLLYASLVAAVAYGLPSATELLWRAAMFAVTAVFLTSFAMMFCLIRNVFLAAFLVLVEFALIGTITMSFVDGNLGGTTDAFGSSITMFRMLFLTVAATLATASLLLSRRLWLRAEFGKA